jgi:hypothetical protein
VEIIKLKEGVPQLGDYVAAGQAEGGVEGDILIVRVKSP